MMHLVDLLQPGSYSVKPASKPLVSQVPKQTKPPITRVSNTITGDQ
jgi:hypothetical protein